MIKINKAKEIRKSDKKRNRFLLQIGKYNWHLTAKEVYSLYCQTLDLVLTGKI